MSQALCDIIFGYQTLHLPYRNFPNLPLWYIAKLKFQSKHFSILTTDLKSREKTDKGE